MNKRRYIHRNRLDVFRSVPLICFAAVPLWLLASALDSEVIATLAAGFGFYLGIVLVRNLFRESGLMLGFLKLGAVSLLLIMNLSWLAAQFFSISTFGRSLSSTLIRDVGTSLTAYACAVAYTLVFASVLGVLGDLKIFRTSEASVSLKLRAAMRVRPLNLLIMLVFICLLEIWLIVVGVISYRTFAVTGYDEGRIPWYLPLLQMTFATQVCLNALSISQMINAHGMGKISKLVVAASISLVLFINFTQGRAVFVVCALLHIYWVVFFIQSVPSIKKFFFAALILSPILYGGSLFSNFMRSGALDAIDIKTVTTLEYFSSALQIYHSNQLLRSYTKTISAENLASRPLVAHPLAKSMALPTGKKNFLLGTNLFNSAIWALPSTIMSDKKKYPIQEDLLYKNFPIGSDDTADSPYLYSYVDFGYAGVFIYPVVLCLIWLITLYLARLNFISSLVVLFLVSVWISMFTLFIGESSMTAYFALLRNTIFALPFVIFLSELFKFPLGIRPAYLAKLNR